MTLSRLLIFGQHTALGASRSGIQRVVIEVAKVLQAQIEVLFVKWDRLDGQLRYFDKRDLANLFGRGTPAARMSPHPACHRVRYRFDEVVDRPSETWLLFPEIPYHQERGNEIFARIVSQCREYGIRVAAIFYDLIPVRDPDYSEWRRQHSEYLLELLRADLIFPISQHSKQDLLAYYETHAGLTRAMLDELCNRVRAIPLGARRATVHLSADTARAPAERAPLIVMVGTIEPRKQQTRFLKVLNELREQVPELVRYQIRLFGSLHPASAVALSNELIRNSNIDYRRYAPDEEIEAAWAEAMFSVFLSRSEGYGLPIIESLRHGVPCLTSNFGAMAEVAEGGGCVAVNALSDEAIARGLIEMVTNKERRAELRREIARRPQRTWEDYAVELVEHCRMFDQKKVIVRGAARAAVASAVEPRSRCSLAQPIGLMTWGFARVENAPAAPFVDSSAWPRADRKSGAAGTCAIATPSDKQVFEMPDHLVACLADVDVLCVPDNATLHALVTRAEQAEVRTLLPSRIVVEAEPGRLVDAVAETICDMSHEVGRAREAADREATLGLAARVLSRQREIDEPTLTIAVSTYDRAPFVEKNVEWLLSLIRGLAGKVKIVVVDNASTDDTMTRLERFAAQPEFNYVRNAANVGMLGNLQVCSALEVSRYIWITGDDDFILPGAIRRVLEAIASYPRIPLLVHNFGVYYRERLAPDDSPQRFKGEMQPLAQDASPTGVRRVNEVAAEHDNLFTAVYPLVFRSDVLAACFNYPFDGVPFGDLTESVPTTKLILERLRYCEVYWFKEEGIIGNAHNSWTRHRPRWHLVLMAKIFDLARSAGVDGAKLNEWAKLHMSLFEEAIAFALRAQTPVNLNLPSDLDNAFRLYRKRLSVPLDVVISSGDEIPLWTSISNAHSGARTLT